MKILKKWSEFNILVRMTRTMILSKILSSPVLNNFDQNQAYKYFVVAVVDDLLFVQFNRL